MSSSEFRLSCIFILISFCIQTLAPSVALADEPPSGSGSIINSSESSSSPSPSSTPAPPLAVVISEVMWMGSDISTADEWVEIAGIGSGGDVRSLSGWTLNALKGTEEAVIARFPASFSIHANEALILSNYSKEASRLAADPALMSTAMSLANTKLLLRLRDSQGQLVDEVDDGVGNPFAGANPPSNGPKASMERIDPSLPGNLQTNWKTATATQGFDAGVPIFGTPGFLSFSTISVSSASFPSSASSSSSSSSSSLSTQPSSSSTTTFSSPEASSISSKISEQIIQVQPYFKIKIHELFSDPIGSDDAEWIELKNTGGDPVNLSGMTIKVGTVGHRIKGSRSGAIISASGYLLIPKSMGGFTLTNNGATVQLLSGSTIIDTFIYPSYPEGVSAGRSEVDGSSDIIPFCIPTPGSSNQVIAPDPQIVIQSGSPNGQAPVSLNLSVAVATGSLAGASCHFDFGDSFTSDSCNPASHSMKIIGDYNIQMSFHDYCGNTVIRSIQGSITAKPFSVRSSKTQAKGSVPPACVPTSFSGVTITEFLPNPATDEVNGEWIEIQNQTSDTQPLCGWSLDDGPGGSHPYLLSAYELPPKTILALPRTQTKIALNNSNDMVQLIAPLKEGGTGAYHTVIFDHAPDDESYAVNGSGSWLWTPYTTPGTENRFQEASTLFQTSPVSISAAFPNPDGADTWDEWIELTNSAAWPIWLNGWVIQNSQGKEIDLTGTVLAKLETKRIYLSRLKFTLGNEKETLSLVDDKKIIRSILPWADAKEEATQQPYKTSIPRETVLVRQVIDATHFVVQIDDDPTHLKQMSLKGMSLPSENQENSMELSSLNYRSKYFVRALLLNKKIDLEIDSNTPKKDGSIAAYAFLDDIDIQQTLLMQGYAFVNPAEKSERQEEYLVFESMAESLKEGMWQSEVLAKETAVAKADAQNWVSAEAKGLSIKFDHKDNFIGTGSVINLTSNHPATLYVSVNGGAFFPWSGALLVASTETIRAYVETDFSDYPSIRSKTIEQTYVVEGDVPRRAIHISEVYPSPLTGETEWIELENRSSEDVSLGGWQLDDAENSGSKPWLIPADVFIPAHGYRLFPADITHLSLSNSGDEVRLLYPSKKIADTIEFKSVKKGRAVAWNTLLNETCLTDTVTPLKSNTCFIQNKKSIQKKAQKKKVKKKSSNKNNNQILKQGSVQKKEIGTDGLYQNLKTSILGADTLVSNLSHGIGFKDILMLFLSALTGILVILFLRKMK